MIEKMYKIEDEIAKKIEEICEFIYENPEEGNKEFISSKYLVDVLEKDGFKVQFPYLEMETAFRAEYVCGDGTGPKVAFLAEYDALPGYGPDKNQMAHTCGHNWIAASCLGASMTLRRMENDFNGTIVVFGTPAEETVGGKCEMADKGAFSDIDAAMQLHLGAEYNINVLTLAMDSIEFNFSGVAAHAAAYPERGVNALDAVQLTFAGINALRQHMQKDACVAGIITEGGVACNTVPDRGTCRFYIRAKHREYLEKLTVQVINCAKGAALMTGTELSYHNFENSYHEMKYNENLRTAMKESVMNLGGTSFVESDFDASGSSDMGNVSQVCPTVYCEIATGAPEGVFSHNECFLDYVHGDLGRKSLHMATKAMSATAIKVMKNPEMVK